MNAPRYSGRVTQARYERDTIPSDSQALNPSYFLLFVSLIIPCRVMSMLRRLCCLWPLPNSQNEWSAQDCKRKFIHEWYICILSFGFGTTALLHLYSALFWSILLFGTAHHINVYKWDQQRFGPRRKSQAPGQGENQWVTRQHRGSNPAPLKCKANARPQGHWFSRLVFIVSKVKSTCGYWPDPLISNEPCPATTLAILC